MQDLPLTSTVEDFSQSRGASYYTYTAYQLAIAEALINITTHAHTHFYIIGWATNIVS